MRILSLKISIQVLVLSLTFSLSLSAERDYLSEAKKRTTQKEFLVFIQSLDKKEVLEFGRQTGKWISNNWQKIHDASWDILMHIIINQYVRKYPEVCSYPSEFVAVFTSKEENSVLRSAFISWLREETKNIPNCFFYFQKPEEVFEALDRIVTDFSDDADVRTSAIITISSLSKITLWAHKHNLKWGNQYFTFLEKWLQQNISHYLKILLNPKENRKVLIDIINELQIMYEYGNTPTKIRIAQAVKKTLVEREQYLPDVQLAIFSWVIRVLKDSSIEQELTNFAIEHPEFAGNIKSILMDLKRIKNGQQ